MNTYLSTSGGRVVDKSRPAEKYVRGWWCVVQRRLIRLCKGEPSAARLYKPARLCDSRTPSHPMHVPTPGTSVPTPSPIHRQSILVQSNVPVYLGHGVLSCSCLWRRCGHPRPLIQTRILPRSAETIGISGYECIPQVLAPENFHTKSRPLIDYPTGNDSPGKCWWSIKWILLCDEVSIFFAVLCALNEKSPFCTRYFRLQKKIMWDDNDNIHNLSIFSSLWHDIFLLLISS